jgi:hypothetical protein
VWGATAAALARAPPPIIIKPPRHHTGAAFTCLLTNHPYISAVPGPQSLPETACDINGCEGSCPRSPLPPGPNADEGDYGTVGISRLAGYQMDHCVRNDDAPVAAPGWNFEQVFVQPASLHRLIETPPMHGPKSRRDDDIETSLRFLQGVRGCRS